MWSVLLVGTQISIRDCRFCGNTILCVMATIAIRYVYAGTWIQTTLGLVYINNSHSLDKATQHEKGKHYCTEQQCTASECLLMSLFEDTAKYKSQAEVIQGFRAFKYKTSWRLKYWHTKDRGQAVRFTNNGYRLSYYFFYKRNNTVFYMILHSFDGKLFNFSWHWDCLYCHSSKRSCEDVQGETGVTNLSVPVHEYWRIQVKWPQIHVWAIYIDL